MNDDHTSVPYTLTKIWTLEAETTFKKFIRTAPFFPADIARSIIEAVAYNEKADIVTRPHVIDGLNRFNKLVTAGTEPFDTIAIRLFEPYGFKPLDRTEIEERHATSVAWAARRAEEWRSE